MYSQTFEVYAPSNNLKISISLKDSITWSVENKGNMVLNGVTIAMDVDGGKGRYGSGTALVTARRFAQDEMVHPVLPLKHRTVHNAYNGIELVLKSGYGLEFRAFDEGVAYRWTLKKKNEQKVFDERMDLKFERGTSFFFPQETSTYSHYEREYLHKDIDSLSPGDFASLPIVWNNTDGTSILFSEADLYDYPNMFMEVGIAQRSLVTKFPKVVLDTEPLPTRPDRSVRITKEADYIALTQGKRTFPWRFFVVAEDDTAFLGTDMVFKLSRPLELEETDWIKPGKVAWDWYNANSVYGVDFGSGLNTETYKYYIDFASEHGLEYVILDEGWTRSTIEILDFNPDMDVKELIAYGRKRNVGIILWCLWKPLDANITTVLETYADWGAMGVKVDFMQRADQYMVNSYTKIAREAAKRKLLVDFHGAYKPSGLRRAYPNVLSYEGVRGNEHNKWSSAITPSHNTTLPFIRMAVGPMDYTPGAMRNAQPENHCISFNRPVSLGTRAHQVAMYVVYESGLQMLCDTPSAYREDGETVDFIAQIPTIWDETKPLMGKMGKYVALARRKDDHWYIGVMNNEDSRSLTLDLSFLSSRNYEATVFADGTNANTYAEDYLVAKRKVTSLDQLTISLANGGGWIAIIRPTN